MTRCTCRETGCTGEAREGFKSCANCAGIRAAKRKSRYHALLPVVTEPSTRMREGIGERRHDCIDYSECLEEFIRARPRADPQAFCPRTCYRPAEQPRATEYVSLNGQGRGLTA